MPAGKCALLEAIADSCSSIIPAADVAVVIAHPDDESLGCGAQLARLKGGTVILVTDGAPCDPCYANRHGFRSTKAYAQARLAETRTALKLAGVPECNLVLMNVPDQEAAWRLEDITSSIVQAFAMRGIRFVLTHSYEGGHPDHDATAFAVHAAAQILSSCGHQIDIIEMPFYRMGTTRRLFQSFTEDRGNRQLSLLLRGDQLALKNKILKCHATQEYTIGMFSADIEQFRLAPWYDFTKLPNGGKLFYETRPWSMTGSRWLDLTKRAFHQLSAPAAA